MRSAEPIERALATSIDGFWPGENADYAQHTVRFFDREFFSARAAKFQRSRGNDHGVNFGSLQVEGTQTLITEAARRPSTMRRISPSVTGDPKQESGSRKERLSTGSWPID